jgi:hypothetical protein
MDVEMLHTMRAPKEDGRKDMAVFQMNFLVSNCLYMFLRVAAVLLGSVKYV